MLVFRVSNLYSDRVQVMQILFSVLDNSDGDKTLANNLAGYSKCVPALCFAKRANTEDKADKEKTKRIGYWSVFVLVYCLFVFPSGNLRLQETLQQMQIAFTREKLVGKRFPIWDALSVGSL